MTQKIKNTNHWLLQNLFWIVPLNFILIIFGIGSGLVQRSKSLQNDNEMKENISIQISSDSIMKKNQDSLLRKTNDLRNLIKK